MARTWYFTSESVTEGHPDKMCDRISDRILDEILAQDPAARVACETTVTTGTCHIMGEITTTAQVDFANIARQTICDIGYTKQAACGFDGESCGVMVSLDRQSADIALGVDKASEAKQGSDDANYSIGAGDQGMMFGYACDETPELMPLSIDLAHKLAKQLSKVRKDGILPYLRPDGKTQVTVQYEDENVCRVDAIVVSSQHTDDVDLATIREDIKKYVILPIIPAQWLDEQTKIFVNPTGRFVIGGPVGDSGLTGRKIIVDTYGGVGRHGGGCFSGKDPTKVDRSAAYAARYVAKQIVAAKLARKCEVQISYAIGVATPMSIYVDTFGTESIAPEYIEQAVRELFDLRPMAIIDTFELRRPIYAQLSSFGHMGREDLNVPWEATDKAQALRALALQKAGK